MHKERLGCCCWKEKRKSHRAGDLLSAFIWNIFGRERAAFCFPGKQLGWKRRLMFFDSIKIKLSEYRRTLIPLPRMLYCPPKSTKTGDGREISAQFPRLLSEFLITLVMSLVKNFSHFFNAAIFSPLYRRTERIPSLGYPFAFVLKKKPVVNIHRCEIERLVWQRARSPFPAADHGRVVWAFNPVISQRQWLFLAVLAAARARIPARPNASELGHHKGAFVHSLAKITKGGRSGECMFANTVQR